jgi:hypothetical protein
MLRRYPDTVRWRQALPPLFVLSLIGLAFLSIYFPLARLLLASEILVYFSIMILAGLHAAIQQRHLHLILGLPLAIAAMHLSWGSGFLWSILSSSFQNYG